MLWDLLPLEIEKTDIPEPDGSLAINTYLGGESPLSRVWKTDPIVWTLLIVHTNVALALSCSFALFIPGESRLSRTSTLRVILSHNQVVFPSIDRNRRSIKDWVCRRSCRRLEFLPLSLWYILI